MRIIYLLLIVASFANTGCKKEQKKSSAPAVKSAHSKAMMLFVNHETYTFEGGTEFTFAQPDTEMTLSYDYDSPGDFGGLKVFYDEMDQTIFDGTIIWMGSGQISIPQQIDAPNQFTYVDQEDFVTPANGFTHVLDSVYPDFDPLQAWAAVQNLQKVRNYLNSNPQAKVNFFKYTPSVGIGNPAEWSYVFVLKD